MRARFNRYSASSRHPGRRARPETNQFRHASPVIWDLVPRDLGPRDLVKKGGGQRAGPRVEREGRAPPQGPGRESDPHGLKIGAPDRIRTCDLCLRRAVIRCYPGYARYLCSLFLSDLTNPTFLAFLEATGLFLRSKWGFGGV